MKSLGAYCSRDPDPRQIKAQVMSSQQFQDLETRVSKFLSTHRTAVENVTKAASNVFEAVCFVIFARHYENIGYQLVPQNLSEGKFRFRYNTNGLPWRYSYFAVHSYEGQSNKPLFEIWHNQKVAGAWVKDKDEDAEQALFAVDIAVTRAGALPADLPFQESGANHQYWVDQSDLITIGEAKKLVAYPMLLAQFLGIVHEIKPQFIGLGDKHDLLALVSQGHPPQPYSHPTRSHRGPGVFVPLSSTGIWAYWSSTKSQIRRSGTLLKTSKPKSRKCVRICSVLSTELKAHYPLRGTLNEKQTRA
jgi:hypothetical protein